LNVKGYRARDVWGTRPGGVRFTGVQKTMFDFSSGQRSQGIDQSNVFGSLQGSGRTYHRTFLSDFKIVARVFHIGTLLFQFSHGQEDAKSSSANLCMHGEFWGNQRRTMNSLSTSACVSNIFRPKRRWIRGSARDPSHSDAVW
jgi:hypothetical protein